MIPVTIMPLQQLKIKAISLYFLLYLFSGPSASGLKLSPFRGESSAKPTVSQTNIDLVSLLHGKPADQNEILSEAIQLLDSMQSAPSCNQRAASSLITSCQAFSAGGNDKEVSPGVDLDHLKSLYAARLAVCEVTGAGATVPEQCTSIFPGRSYNTQPHQSNYRGPHDSHEDHLAPYRQLEPCLKSLESKPQWWTSYSNSRQNAAVMCQAARFDIEREELLNHHRELAEISFGMRDALNRSFNDAMGQSAHHKTFLENLNKMRLKFLHDVQEDTASAKADLISLFTNTKGIFEAAGEDFRKLMGNAVSDVDILSKNMRSFDDSIHQLKQVLSDTHVERLRQNSETANFEQVTLQTNVDLATTLHQSLDEINGLGLKVITEEFGRLHTSLYSLNDVISTLHHKHNSLDERIQQFDQAFRGFENRAVILEDMMISQIVNHTRLQQSFQSDILTTQTLLLDITSSAAELQSTIGDAQQIFQNIMPFKNSMGLISWWPYCVFAFCVLAVFSPKSVANLGYFCMIGVSLLCMGAFDCIRAIGEHAWNAIGAASYLDVACFALGFILSSTIIIFIATRGYYLVPTLWAMRYGRLTASDASALLALP